MKLRIFEECMTETLYKGDCLIEMNKIADKSVDMILCDLPYGTTACKWDVIIPFDKLWEQYNRIVKSNGVIVLFGSEPFSSKLICSNISNFSHSWIWEKEQGSNFLLSNIQPMKIHENIMVFYPTFDDTESNLELREYFYSEKEKGNLSNKQINELLGYSTKGSGMAGHYFKKDKTQFIFPKKSDYLKLQQTGFFQKSYDELLILYESNKSNKRTFNQQFTEGKKYITKQGGISDVYGNKHKDIITVNEGKRFPKSILKFNRDKEKLHPTQKPIALLEYLIKTYTNENETVLDNCMGSGSTGVACINTNRNFIGIEKDDKYFEIAKDRIEKAKESLFDM